MFQEGHRIPHGDEAEAHDAADVGSVDQLVYPSGLKPGWHVDVTMLRLDVFVLHTNE